MDLRNDQITLGELWDNAGARRVFLKRIPLLIRHPIKGQARSVTLGQLKDFAGSWLPAKAVSELVEELKKL